MMFSVGGTEAGNILCKSWQSWDQEEPGTRELTRGHPEVSFGNSLMFSTKCPGLHEADCLLQAMIFRLICCVCCAAKPKGPTQEWQGQVKAVSSNGP